MVAGYSGIADCIAVIGRNNYVLCAVSESIDLYPSDECGYGHGDACGEGLSGYIIGEGRGYGGAACCNADHGCGLAASGNGCYGSIIGGPCYGVIGSTGGADGKGNGGRCARYDFDCGRTDADALNRNGFGVVIESDAVVLEGAACAGGGIVYAVYGLNNDGAAALDGAAGSGEYNGTEDAVNGFKVVILGRIIALLHLEAIDTVIVGGVICNECNTEIPRYIRCAVAGYGLECGGKG